MKPHRNDPGERGAAWKRRTNRWRTWSSEMLLLNASLAVLAIVATTLTLVFPENPVLGEFGPEIAVNALAILVTIAIVQRMLERQERRRRLRGSIAGLRRNARALARLQDAWAVALKGCLPEVPEGGCASTAELFVGVRTEELMYLDPRAVHPTAQVPVAPWLVAEIDGARRALRSVIRQYRDGFDVEYLEALEELTDDPFPKLVSDALERGSTAREWRVSINGGRGARVQHFAQLLEALDLHGRIAVEAAALRGARARPRTAELGVPLANDHDLRVRTALPSSWWNSAPGVGSFRQPRPKPAPAMPVGTDVARHAR